MSNKTSRKAQPSAHGRSSRPGLQRSGSSFNHAGHHSSGSKSATSSHERKKSGLDITYRPSDPHEDSMAPGLPQFCAMCEKQIVTPGNSILYCSEFCRKKDVSSPMSMSIQTIFSPSGNLPTATSYFDTPQPKIIEPRSPTILRPASIIYSDISTSEPESPLEEEPQTSTLRVSNEASRYLAQFHSTTYTMETTRTPRPRTSRNQPTTEGGPPSLSHTPSSSMGTVASMDRSLPRRHAFEGSLHSSAKSVDLVMPCGNYFSSRPNQVIHDESLESSTSTLTPDRVREGDGGEYERRELARSERSSGGSGGIKRLFVENGGARMSGGVSSDGRYEDESVGI